MHSTLQYAAADWIGVLIFVGVVIFQIVGALMKATQKPQRPNPAPQQPNRPQRPAPRGDQPLDPLEELMEALGKKPGQMPSQLPHPPKQVNRPVPPLTPAESAKPAQPKVVVVPKTPTVARPLSESAPDLTSAQGETARVQAEIEQRVDKPMFVTSIGSHESSSEKAAASIAKAAGVTETADSRTMYRSHATPTSSVSSIGKALRNPADLRRAIILNEVLGKPVGLRE